MVKKGAWARKKNIICTTFSTLTTLGRIQKVTQESINAILVYIESTKLVTQNNVWKLGRGFVHYSLVQANNWTQQFYSISIKAYTGQIEILYAVKCLKELHKEE